jgi:ribonuclease G
MPHNQGMAPGKQQDILINVSIGEVRVAAVEDGRLQALSCTRLLGADEPGGVGLIGDIVLGRVVRVVPAVQAAFVEIGHERAGFLGARELRCLTDDPTVDPSIGAVLREGDKVLVQIVKEPIGDKGARLTANITIPGRLSVFTPLQPGVGISRRIEDDGERARLAAIGEKLFSTDELKGGCILRTAAVGADEEELFDDLIRLEEEWGEISAARKAAKVPSTLRRDLGPVERALRDMVNDTTRTILIDDAKAAVRARAYCRDAMPDMEAHVVLFEGPGTLFSDLEGDIEGLVHPRVPLPCGGWITVEGTEALTAVDVNSGSFTHATAVEDTGAIVNVEAAREIGRQIRLRGIGGLIVIDFIHMKEPDHVETVLAELTDSLTRDGVPVNVGPVTAFGLVEVTRKRVRGPLASLWREECATCDGLGRLRRADAVAMDVLRRIEETAKAAPGLVIVVRAAAEVVAWMEQQGALDALAEEGIGRVSLQAGPGFARERFEVGTGAKA